MSSLRDSAGAPAGPFELGPWRVDPADGSVTGQERTTRLEPRTMSVLLCLAASRGKVVSQQDILDFAWSDAAVESGAVAKAIWEIRRALGDDARDASFVETLPRRGYRLKAPAPDLTPRRARRLWAASSLAAAAGVGLVAWALVGRAAPYGTTDPEAARAYERAIERNRRGGEEDLRLAVAMLERATSHDPEFAEAWAELALARARANRHGDDLSAARSAADRALALRPADGRALIASARVLELSGEPVEALARYGQAERVRPNDTWLLRRVGHVRLRLGRMEESLSSLQRAYELDRVNGSRASDLGMVLALLRRYDEAEHFFDESIQLAPDAVHAYLSLARLKLVGRGDAPGAREVIARLPGGTTTASLRLRLRLELAVADRPAALRELLRAMPDAIDDRSIHVPRELGRAWLHEALGEDSRAADAFAAARTRLAQSLAARPDDARLQTALAHALAGLDRKAEALGHAFRAVELVPFADDALRAPLYAADLARIQVRVGELSAARATLDDLLARPAGMAVSEAYVNLDRAFAPLGAAKRRDRPAGSVTSR